MSKDEKSGEVVWAGRESLVSWSMWFSATPRLLFGMEAVVTCQAAEASWTLGAVLFKSWKGHWISSGWRVFWCSSSLCVVLIITLFGDGTGVVVFGYERWTSDMHCVCVCVCVCEAQATRDGHAPFVFSATPVLGSVHAKTMAGTCTQTQPRGSKCT